MRRRQEEEQQRRLAQLQLRQLDLSAAHGSLGEDVARKGAQLRALYAQYQERKSEAAVREGRRLISLALRLYAGGGSRAQRK